MTTKLLTSVDKTDDPPATHEDSDDPPATHEDSSDDVNVSSSQLDQSLACPPHDDVEDRVLFYPPLYHQRYLFAVRRLTQEGVISVSILP